MIYKLNLEPILEGMKRGGRRPLGSDAELVVRNAPAPVLLVRAGGRAR